MNKELYRLEVTVPEEDYDRLSGLLTLEVAFGWEEESLPSGETRFRIHCEQEDFLLTLLERIREELPQAVSVCAPIENKDWRGAWREFFTPVP